MNVEDKRLTERTVERDAEAGRIIPAASKAVDLEARTVEDVASTNRVDRDGEIIHPEAFRETLPGFLASNAPLLSAHTHRAGDATPTQVGWVMDAQIEKTRVVMTVKFARTEAAEEWWTIASDPGGKGLAVSIGFRPLRYVAGTAKEIAEAFPDLKRSIREAGLADEDRLVVFTAIELYELSCVPVPSNRLALQIRSAMKALAGTDGEDADAAEGLAEAIGEAVREAVREGLADVRSETHNLKSAIDELSEFVLALTPDLVGCAPPPPSPGGDDPAGPAGERQGDDADVAAARDLLAACRSKA